MTLYELSGEYAQLMEQLETAESKEDVDAIYEAMGELEGDIADKAEAYARIMRNLEASAEAFKAEKLRLAKRQQAMEDAVARLKARMLEGMKLIGTTYIHTSIGKWRIQKNPPSCTVIDADAIPVRWHIPQPDKIDASGILSEWKATGEIPDGCDIQQREGLRFR